MIISIFIVSLFELMLGIRLGLSQGPTAILKGMEGVTDQMQTYLSQDIGYQLSALAVAIWGILSYLWYRSETRGELHGKPETIISGKNLTLFLLLGIGSQCFFSGAIGLLQRGIPQFFEAYSETVKSLLHGNMTEVVLYTVLIAPIAEELAFRGVILHKASKVLPFFGANILQAVFFGIYHQNIVQGIYAALLGFLFGLACRKFNTVYAPILLHVLVNASAFFVMLIPYSIQGNALMAAGGAILMMFTSIQLDLWKDILPKRKTFS